MKACISRHLDQDGIDLDVGFLGGKYALPPSTDAASSPINELAARTMVVRLTPSRVHLSLFPAAPARSTSACPECLDRRSLSTLTVDEQWSTQLGFPREQNGAPNLMGAALENIGLLSKSILRQNAPASSQAVYSVDLITQEVAVYELMRDSLCNQCADEEPVSQENAVLALRDTLPARSGKSRMKSLLEYDLPTKALINPVCGSAGVHSIPGYVQSVTAPIFSQYVQRIPGVKPRIVGWSGFTTRTDESRTAGILESLERQAGMLATPKYTTVFGSYESLAEQAMDPALCLAYNEESYSLPIGLTRYTPDLPIEWIWGHSLFSGRAILVPKQLVFYNRVPKTSTLKTIVHNNSSGCALGSCYEEAILKGLGELLERDSFVISWHRMLSLPRIDLADCPDLKTRLIMDRIKFLDFELTLLDGRLDMKIPTIIAVARRRDQDVGAMSVGAAASTDPNEAIRSALLEAASSIVELPVLYNNRKARVDELLNDYYAVKSVTDHMSLYALPAMAEQVRWMDNSPVVRSVQETFQADRDWHSDGDIAGDLKKVLAELARCGMHEAVVVDLTTREQHKLGLKTVRVIVPGLAPIDFGHPRNRVESLPRVHSAPAAAGLACRVNAGDNPLPHPFP
ncbi:TOMM precursor leader peptide-binding protein [Massilia antarctica]|uniref:TOMM precursor leader peptide-binding protein n=1 Tax=Massilia antarctica TaxID=2765360 RepID=UPI0011AFAB92|nr:TOMM precursor leader peptide-binding protein [Massilia sp. H27-R4]